MSDEKISELEAKIDGISQLAPWIKSLLAGAFAIGVWVTRLQMQVSGHESMGATLHSLELAVASSANNRYTSEDHLKYAMTMQETLNAQERRLSLMEDLGKRVMATLDRIELRMEKKGQTP
jgi:hypothetical protein